MSERCPLLVFGHREGVPVDVPEQCQIQCGELMELVSLANNGEVDDYRANDTCNDFIEFSHDAVALASLADASLRRYHVVDKCASDACGEQEIQETTWTFTCPHSN